MLRNHRDVRKSIAWLGVIAAGGLIIYLIMIPPVIGMADNGDFNRVIGISGIAPLDKNEPYDERYFAYSHTIWAYGGYTHGGYVSTHVLLVAVSGWISRIFSWHHYDIRFIGACYTALLLLAIALFVRHSPLLSSRKLTAFLAAFTAAAIVWVFGDIGYAAYFQSFFGEPYALIGMLLTAASAIALASADMPSRRMLALFIGATLAVATAKIQNAPLGFAFALLVWRMMPLRPDRSWRRQTITGICLLTACAAIMLVFAPDRLVHANRYQTIFYGVLKDSPDVAKDMQELGIPEKYEGLAGTNYYETGTVIPQSNPALRREVLDQVEHKDIALFYLKHPDRFVDKLRKAAAAGASIRPYYLGNYEMQEGKPPRALSYQFSSWSQWKAHQMPHSLTWFASIYALYIAGLAIWRMRAPSRRARLVPETLAVVALSGAFAFAIPLIGDGEADLGKHLFMFNVCFDMMVVSVLVGACYGIMRMLTIRNGE
ncbi:hypothetical protein COLU111180_16590 [Cohnella lubricantis]|uniref:Glycosyltransferase RgtA/B/C/D-like domain-containing protein n=1 Tax=Cohnella lubricantis TaxID=2163172 RepID=A0A841TKW5_9BACL|nr:hypothetical protein [Cohnella lubricantis]MBB6679171.1 hypothetical protein [Cohnella lubricantis]MBP2119325.1 hypothetical protein [Cohnella lubricantis]